MHIVSVDAAVTGIYMDQSNGKLVQTDRFLCNYVGKSSSNRNFIITVLQEYL
jgi:hypothetical protein